MEFKKYTIKHLIEAFKQVGSPISASWVRRQEEKGNLILPKSPTNFKMAQGARRPGAVRQLSASHINDVLKAFLPEGTSIPDQLQVTVKKKIVTLEIGGGFANGKGYYSYKTEEGSIPHAIA